MAVERSRDLLGTELAALVGESYERAYGDMVRVQQLTELEEVIAYSQGESNSFTFSTSCIVAVCDRMPALARMQFQSPAPSLYHKHIFNRDTCGNERFEALCLCGRTTSPRWRGFQRNRAEHHEVFAAT